MNEQQVSEPRAGVSTGSPHRRLGITIPLWGPLYSQRSQLRRIEALGYQDLWSAEAMGYDGFTPLALASQWTSSVRLGTAIVPVYTRGPALLASSAASMADAAPGRFVLGIGTSSNVIVEEWNGIAFDRPYQRVRDTVTFLRAALAGEKVTEEYDTFSVSGFRLGTVSEHQPPIMVAALRQQMLRLAGRIADGVIINWLGPDDVTKVVKVVRDAASGQQREVVARLFVIVTEDRDAALATARRAIAAYLNVPVYRAFHEWLGRTDAMANHWLRWEAGDRRGALEEIPEAVVDDLVISGSIEHCRAQVSKYFRNGVTTAVLSLLPAAGVDLVQAIEDLAPARSRGVGC